jgi:N-acetylglucosamine-6-sulfatase
VVRAVVAALVLAAGVAAPAAPAQARPNVVVLMTDDQTVESLRVMPRVRDLLARRGTTFRQSVVSFPMCCPSRATFLTGQYAHNHGVLGNAPPEGGYGRLDHTNTLPVWLERSGYHTAHVGKYLHGYGTTNPREIPPGWSDWYGSLDPSTYNYYGFTLNENGSLRTYGRGRRNYQTDVYARKAVGIIRRRAVSAQPFFLSVAFLAPHAGRPYERDDPTRLPVGGLVTAVPAARHRDRFAAEPLPRPPSFDERDVSDKPRFIRNRRMDAGEVAAVAEMYRQRLESLLAVDEAVAAIVGALRRAGELEETLIVLTSDNGFFHGEHRFRMGKERVYEPSIRVPLILRGPGIPRGLRLDTLVANVDLAPTIVDATGALPGRVLDGRSLLPLVQRLSSWPPRDILIERGPGADDFDAIRTQTHLYAEYATGERELYDLVRDPHELRSLHDDPRQRARVEDLARRLAFLRTCRGLVCHGADWSAALEASSP